MNQYPRDPNGLDNRQELLRQQELLRLQQEERRLKAAQRRARLAWVRNAILFLVGALEVLLGLRFFLRISLANPENAFAQFIFNLSDPFIAPFATLFISPTNADASRIFDLNVLVAMVIYALLGLLALALVNFFEGQD
ncbi:MAG: YggT family protein [Leptolyngbyaceae cyanobacterium SM2_3_12]|nr:YggT family protein [Leptolyngbyaceae cyanobacterium SM2_3_12]